LEEAKAQEEALGIFGPGPQDTEDRILFQSRVIRHGELYKNS